ncbi:MAG: ComEC/Rec2 family competence protein, partial [Anaerolineae bacterium]
MISGFNITIVAGLLTATLGRLVGKKRAFYPVVAGIVVYTLLVGADAAVTRAALMGILYAWAVYLGRRSTAIVSLFAAGLLMTLLNPLSLWDVGFQLSFMATLSLILFTPAMTERFERLAARLLPPTHAQTVVNLLNDALIVTLSATILTLPLVAHYFGRVSIVSPLANLLVLPVQPYVMIWGGLAVIVGLISDLANLLWPVARLLALIPWLALHWTVAVVQWLAPLPFAAANVTVGLPALWGFYGLLALLILSSRPTIPILGTLLQRARGTLSSSTTVTTMAVALLAAGSLLMVAFRALPDGRLHVHFLDVQRGEAILIETPDGQ